LESKSDFTFDSVTLDDIHRLLQALAKSDSEDVHKIVKEVFSD